MLHDLNLAMRWADRIVVLAHGAIYAVGAAAQALTPEIIAAVYGVEARAERCSRGRLQIIVDGVCGHDANARAKPADAKEA